jgi:hypothetical protein
MADKEAEKSTEDGPSLEMPSFGFGRKKGKRGKAAQEPAPEAVSSEELPREEAAAAEAAPVPPAADPVPDPEPETEPVAAAPVEETRQLDPVDHAPEPQAPPLFVDETPAAATPVAEPAPELAPEPAPEPKRKARRSPALGGMPAAIVTGALIGLLQVGLTWGALHLCELVRGTSACGKPGFFVLLAIMVILIVVGALLLKAWGIGDPGSTSFLGVGLVAVLLLLFLVKLLFNWWMVIVVPILGMLSFALAYWLSTAFVESD